MSRSGPTIHVRSQRRRGAFDWLERLELYPRIAAGIDSGESNVTIARALGISDKTVARFRRRGVPKGARS